MRGGALFDRCEGRRHFELHDPPAVLVDVSRAVVADVVHEDHDDLAVQASSATL